MMRKKALPTNPDSPSKQIIADYFGIDVSDVKTELQPDTYTVYLAGNDEAKQKYRDTAPFGTGERPGKYNFNEPLLVRWTGRTVKPV